MTDQTLPPEIVFKEGYLITCGLYRLLPDELLVNLIHSVNLAALHFDFADTLKIAAAEVIAGFIKTTHSLPVTGAGLKALHRKCLKVIDPVVDHPDLSVEEKKVRLSAAVTQCWQMIKKRKDVTHLVILPDKFKVMLPPEFVVVCFLCGMSPVELLQYFINRISVVRDLSSHHFCPEYNPCTTFVNTSLDKYAPKNEPLIVLKHQAYLKKMLLLDEEMKGEPDHQKRFRQFEALAREWYLALQKVTPARGELSKWLVSSAENSV